MKNQYDYDKLLASYFSGNLPNQEKEAIEQWRDSCGENRTIFNNAEKVWRSLELLQEMKRYNAVHALADINLKTKQISGNIHKGLLFYWQRIAAILLLPLLIIGGIYFLIDKNALNSIVVWQTITTPPGVKSQVQLPDGTKVWLNSESSLRYPSSFSSYNRDVELKGEAYFEVVKDDKHPFFVDLGRIEVEVVGTEFNVINYGQEKQTEVVLASGKVKLLEKQKDQRLLITEMVPGQRVVYLKTRNKFSISQIDPEKYISWTNGQLIFKDDPMDEVVRRLDRWFNVIIEIEDSEIAQYIYTATFRDETIEQVLNLLARTSPIKYDIIPGKRLSDGSFETQRIILKKTNKKCL